MKNKIILGLGVVAVLGTVGSASAANIQYDQNVTTDVANQVHVIMGSQIGNGGFTTHRENGIELGLRARVPYSGPLTSNGDGSYSYNSADIDLGGDSSWNFDWTVNSNYDGTGPGNLNSLTYLLEFDYDPTAGVNYYGFGSSGLPLQSGDPITPNYMGLFFDHSIGTNSTLQSAGTEASNPANYAALLASNNVLQNSWRGEWMLAAPSGAFNPYTAGTYNIRLSAFLGGVQEASTEITVLINGGGGPAVVPVPAAAPLGLLGMGLVAFVRRRKNAKA